MARSRTAPERRKTICVTLAASLCVALVAGEVGRRAIYGDGRLHAWTKAAYRRVQAALSGAASAPAAKPERAAGPLVVYRDALAPGWEDWSWATRDLASRARAYRGQSALRMVPEAFKGIYLHHAPLSTAGYGSLQVFVYGTAGLTVGVVGRDLKFGKQVPLERYLRVEAALPPGWRSARIPLSDLGLPGSGGTITGVVFQAATGTLQPEVFLDEISLEPDLALPAAPAAVTVPVVVDVTADRHPISPYIYGMGFAPKEYVSDLRLGCNRWGGNHMSRYNWVHGDACNAARDWRWANRGAWWHASTAPKLAAGPSSAADQFISDNRAGGATTLLTLPTIGWVAKDNNPNTTSINVPADGGPPLGNAEGVIAGYDPAENRARTSIRSVARKRRPFTANPTLAEGVVYQDEWVHHLTKKFGGATAGGVRFYAMDNEPDLWSSTHTDVHPARMGYDDLLNRFLEYGAAVKAVDPTAQVTGPVSWGWTGYFYSPLDLGTDGYRTHAERKRHGGDPFLLWFLKQVREHDRRAGKRTLDVLDVHYYPQGEGLYSGSTEGDARLRRLRATRSLWDPKYVDESWIGEPVRLIPRLKEWIAAGYPGTKIGISEWNFGAETDVSGGLAVADALGIFGRDGVYVANYWAHPPKGSSAYLAFKLYRNADGKNSGFGDVSCRAVSGSPEQVSCFAATDTKTGELTLMLVNKLPWTTATVPLTLAGEKLEHRTARAWRLSVKDPTAIVPLASLTPTARSLTLTLPPYSATLLRLTPGTAGE